MITADNARKIYSRALMHWAKEHGDPCALALAEDFTGGWITAGEASYWAWQRSKGKPATLDNALNKVFQACEVYSYARGAESSRQGLVNIAR